MDSAPGSCDSGRVKPAVHTEDAGEKGAGGLPLRRAIRHAASLGVFFGFAASTCEVVLWTVGGSSRGLATPRDSLVVEVVLCSALGLVLGVALTPLLQRFGGRARILHPLVLCLSWAGLGFVARVPHHTLLAALTVAPWVVAFAVTAATDRLMRYRPALRVAPGISLTFVLVAALVVPTLLERLGAVDAVAPARYAPPEGAPDVLVVVLDALRADHVGAYGYRRDTTPVFDHLAREATLFVEATAPATWALPSHASLFTGTFPTTHGAHAEHQRLEPSGPRTLAEVLADHGYETRCFTASPWLSGPPGLTRGFSWTDDTWRSGRADQTRLYALRLLDRVGLGAHDNGGAEVTESFETWIAEAPASSGPTFAFVNLTEASFPYHQVPPEHLARFTDEDPETLRAISFALMEAQLGGEAPDPEVARRPATDMYDAGVHYADELLGRLVAALERRGRLDDTLLIVLSDYGELLGEYATFGHGLSLHREEIHVPLLIRYPAAFEATTVEAPVSTAAVFATVLDVLGITTPDRPEVRTLREVVRGRPAGLVLSERYALPAGRGRDHSPLFDPSLRFRSFRDDDLELIVTSGDGVYLYDLASEAAERRDVAAERADDVARLDAHLRHLAAAVGLAHIDGTPIDPSDAHP